MGLRESFLRIFAAGGEKLKPEPGALGSDRSDPASTDAWLAVKRNPDEVLRDEGRTLQHYRELMVKDPKVRAAIRERRVSARRRPWEIVPAGDTPADLEAREAVEAMLLLLPMERINNHLLAGIGTGVAVAEIVWETRDILGRTLIVPAKILGRPARRFVFDHENHLRMLTREQPQNGVELPERKFLVFTHEPEDDNPYGQGEAKFVYWYSWFKRQVIDSWVRMSKKFGSPTSIATYPDTYTDEQIDDLEAVIAEIEEMSGVTIPGDVKVTLLESELAKAGNLSFIPLIQLLDDGITQAIIGQTLSSGEGRNGTQALGAVHLRTKEELTACDCEELMEVFNGQLIPWICGFNFNVDRFPRFVINYDAKADQKSLAERDRLLQQMGVEIPESYVRETYGIPAPKDGEPVLQAAAPPAAPGSPLPEEGGGPPDNPPATPSDGPAREFARKLTLTERLDLIEFSRERHDRIDELSERALRTFGDPMRELRDAFDAAVQSAGALPSLASWRMAPPLPLVDIMERLVLAGRLEGRVSVVDEARRSGWTPDGRFRLAPVEALDFIAINILNLVPTEALKLFASKLPMTQEALKAVADAARRKAFSIAGDVTEQFVSDVQKARAEAFEQGKTLKEFTDSVRQIYQDHGYTPASNHYLETVFRNTAAEAYNGARWQQMNDPDLGDFYWGYEYLTVGDDRTRPAHAALAGFVAPKADPVWRTIWPPNGHRCRCATRGVTKADARRRGLTGPSPFPAGFTPDPGWDHNPGATE
ncbi:MAG: DUF935 family protein [Deltaproteobacteria bacterium]|nr:DUF935 family protein [Deltaproteobacteria bacterium]